MEFLITAKLANFAKTVTIFPTIIITFGFKIAFINVIIGYFDSISLMKRLLIILSSALCFAGCAEKPETEKASVERFDIDISAYPEMNPEQRDSFRLRYSDAVAFAIQGDTVNADSALATYARGKAVKMFGPDITERFTVIDSIETVLGSLKAGIAEKLPSVEWKKPVGVISTYNQSVIIADRSLLIGLNHYLGSDYPAYSYFEPYQRAVKTPKHLPYDVAEAIIANKFPYQRQEDASLLNRMLYEGALLTAVNSVIANSDAAESMGYGTDEWKWLAENEKNVWSALIDRELLFSIDPSIVERMTRPAPATSIIHPDAPGRTGRYIGYKIAQAYLKRHPEKSIEWLLSPEFYNSPTALIESQYAPK